MIRFEEAYKIVCDNSRLLGIEEIDFLDATNRVLAEDIFSDIDMPPFNKSAVDGYACKLADFNKNIKLEITEIIPAGSLPLNKIEHGKCSKIMTGAMLPEGADVVVMLEDTKIFSDNKLSFTSDKTNKNICFIAEDVRRGDLVLAKGSYIKPQHIAILASVGAVRIPVYKKPVVTVLSTGTELVEPNQMPIGPQIRNSNASQIIAQINEAGGIPEYIGISPDSDQLTYENIFNAFAKSDIVVASGGVSMGDFDYVTKIIKELNLDIKFNSIAVQPGRPTVFAVLDNKKYFFGLPGNPVSAFVQFELLAKPFIQQLQGFNKNENTIKLPLGENISRKKSERKSFIPVCIKNNEVFHIEYNGSAHIHSYIAADGMISLEIGCNQLNKGEIVDVRQL